MLWGCSACGGRASFGLHFTWRRDVDGVRALLPRVEAALAPFDARPHWGKLFTMSTAAARLYPLRPRLLSLLHEHDPRRKFSSRFLERDAALGDPAARL